MSEEKIKATIKKMLFEGKSRVAIVKSFSSMPDFSISRYYGFVRVVVEEIDQQQKHKINKTVIDLLEKGKKSEAITYAFEYLNKGIIDTVRYIEEIEIRLSPRKRDYLPKPQETSVAQTPDLDWWD